MNYLKLFSISYYIGMALFLIGIILQLNHSIYGPFFMAFGLFPILGVRIYNKSIASKDRSRIHTIFVASALFLAVAVIAAFMNKNYWVLFVFIAAVLDGYVSFRKVV